MVVGPDGQNAGVLIAEVVATADTVAATRARTVKVRAIAELLRKLEPDEVAVTTGWLAGKTRQRRIGVGWASIAAVEVSAADEPSLEILEVDATLTRLQETAGAGSAAARAELLRTMLSRATDREADFIRRILIGELRMGALDGVVTDGVAAAAGLPLDAVRRASMLAGDLPSIARIAMTGGDLGAIGLQVLTPVSPMLAATAADVTEALELTGRASVEWKLDGARIQVHRNGSEVRIYTRNLNDITDRLPGIVAGIRELPCARIILDGEAIGLDEDRPEAFQQTVSRFARQDGVSGAALVSRFFDCLHLDGTDLIDRPLAERIELLERVAGPLRIPGRITDDPAEAQAVLDESLATGHEGVLVKAIDSTYDAGRRGGSWRKVKPVKTLDLVVLAIEWGNGRRKGWLSNLHLGARDPDRPGEFVMVGKTFKGMTDAMLAWQTKRFTDLAIDGTADYVVRVRPEQVVEIALDGVQTSPRYPGKVALRFARVRGYRDDKSPEEADTIQTVQEMLPGRA